MVPPEVAVGSLGGGLIDRWMSAATGGTAGFRAEGAYRDVGPISSSAKNAIFRAFGQPQL